MAATDKPIVIPAAMVADLATAVEHYRNECHATVACWNLGAANKIGAATSDDEIDANCGRAGMGLDAKHLRDACRLLEFIRASRG